MAAISFHVSKEANERSVDINLAQQFGGFALALQQRYPGTGEDGQIVRAPLYGMGRTFRLKGPDGKWRDNNGNLCPERGRDTYPTGEPNAQMNCGMD